jgi:hypothetical protein
LQVEDLMVVEEVHGVCLELFIPPKPINRKEQ